MPETPEELPVIVTASELREILGHSHVETTRAWIRDAKKNHGLKAVGKNLHGAQVYSLKAVFAVQEKKRGRGNRTWGPGRAFSPDQAVDRVDDDE